LKIQGEHLFDAPRDVVWRALLDPEVLSRTLPGCERLERLAGAGENSLQGLLNVQVGPVKGQFEGTLQLSDLRPLEGYHMKLEGRGAAGFLQGEGDLRLSDSEGGKTRLAYDIEAQVGGRVAGVGQRLLDSSAKVITRQGLEGLGRQLEAIQKEAPPPAAPSQTRMAAELAHGVFQEMVPEKRRPWLLVGSLALLVVLVLLAARACG
jgi:carbon monoxide dehydrogenase subunit G